MYGWGVVCGYDISGFLSFPVKGIPSGERGKGEEPRDIPKLSFHLDW